MGLPFTLHHAARLLVQHEQETMYCVCRLPIWHPSDDTSLTRSGCWCRTVMQLYKPGLACRPLSFPFFPPYPIHRLFFQPVARFNTYPLCQQ